MEDSVWNMEIHDSTSPAPKCLLDTQKDPLFLASSYIGTIFSNSIKYDDMKTLSFYDDVGNEKQYMYYTCKEINF